MGVTETGLRARQPDASGFATAPDGISLYWEVHGDGRPAIVLLPPNPISHSRIWKGQVHYLARSFRVVTYDGRGNGRSGSPDPAVPWQDDWNVIDCLAVLEATATDTAVLAGICTDGIWPAVQIAAEHPERVLGIVALAPGVPLGPPLPWRAHARATYDELRTQPQGWDKENRAYIRAHHRDFLEFFFGEMFPEPHSTKAIEDAVAYGLDGPVAALTMDKAPPAMTQAEVADVCRRVRCPVTVVQGDQDNCQPFARGVALAELTGGEHLTLTDAGHVPNVRHPVLVNRLMHDFAARCSGGRRTTWVRAGARPRRALLVSSPIGLGHSWRDVAIARELRRLTPGLQIEWLAQPPVTATAGVLRRDDSSRQRATRARSRAYRRGGGRARARRVPCDPSPRRDLLRELHGLQRRRHAGALRPLDRRRGMGGRLLPAREPRAQDRALRLAHRLRRHAADAAR